MSASGKTAARAPRAFPPAVLGPAVVALALALYCAWLWQVGRFPGTDETFYKAAGREWATSGRFAAPELEGLFHLEPPLQDVFFAYPPLYPWFFGLLVKLLGFGWRQCVLYDALIHAALVVAVYRLTARVGPDWPAAARVGVALAVLPLGTAGRPDELAMVFGLLALTTLLSADLSRSSVFRAGLLFGLTAATGPAVAAVLGLQALVLAGTSQARPRLGPLVILLGTSAVVLAAVEAPILWSHPDAYRQFLHQPAVGGRVARGLALADLPLWRHGLPMLFFTALAAAAGLGDRAVAGRREWLRRWAAPLVAAAAVVVLLPGKHTYLWFSGPWLLIAIVSAALEAVRARRRARTLWLCAALAAALAAGAGRGLHHALVLLCLPEDQTLAAGARRLRARVPPGSTVVTDEFWWVLAADHRVLDATWSQPARLEGVDYVALSANGTGVPGRPRALPDRFASYVSRNFVTLQDDLNRGPARLGPLRLSRSGYGFGALLLGRAEASGHGKSASAQ